MAHRDLNTVDHLSTEQHWDNFADFCYYDMLSGGPDAHLTLAGYMSKDLPLRERLWHAGVYVGVYNVPTAEIIWSTFSHKDMMKISHKDLTYWLTENWKGITTRTERKCVRVPANMAFYFKNYAEWVDSYPWKSLQAYTPEQRYENLWVESQKSVKFLGRYSGFKLLEYYTKWCDIPIKLPDIRPIGGWSPRSMLSILYPDYKDILLGDDSPKNIATINDISNNLLDWLNSHKGTKWINGMDLYKMEVFLCDYKQCYFGRRQYPGRSQDSEIQYHEKISAYWDYDFEMIRARSEIFPNWTLGEKNGWTNVRKELGTVLYDYGYMWSDSLYDYKNTLDLSVPTPKVCKI